MMEHGDMEEGEYARLRLVSDGNPRHTRLLTPGRTEIAGVQQIKWHCVAGDITRLEVTFVASEIKCEITGPPMPDMVPSCR